MDRYMNAKRSSALSLVVCLTACAGHDEGQRVTVGFRPEAGSSPAPGSSVDAGLGAPGKGADATVVGPPNALTVRVEDIQKMTLTIVTLACAGDCVDIEAVPSGGHPPYAYAWDDGSTEAKRHVCLSASQRLSVQASDTAIVAPEFGYAAQRASAEVSARVLQSCTDAGVPSGEFCIKNPSLEGKPSLAELGLELPDWSVCFITPDVNPLFSGTPASDGATYLGLIASTPDFAESAGTSFCTPLAAGKPISFSVDVAVSSYAAGPAKLQLWGGATSCSKDQLLWTSPTIEDLNTWHTFCGTLTPSSNFPYLVLWPIPTTLTGGYVLVDNFKPKVSCP